MMSSRELLIFFLESLFFEDSIFSLSGFLFFSPPRKKIIIGGRLLSFLFLFSLPKFDQGRERTKEHAA